MGRYIGHISESLASKSVKTSKSAKKVSKHQKSVKVSKRCPKVAKPKMAPALKKCGLYHLPHKFRFLNFRLHHFANIFVDYARNIR